MTKNTYSIQELKDIAMQVRRDIIRMIYGAQSGHPGGSLGCADLFTALYFKHLNIEPENFTFEGNNEDMFFLSNGHISPVWYSTLARRGYFDIKELSTFRKINSRLQGHPSPTKKLEGIRMSSGSLGQGLSNAIGACLNKKLDKEENLVYCLTGDGELQEGQVWEAIMYAGAKQLDNLIAIVDYNNKQIDGAIDDVLTLGNLRKKWESFLWEVIEMDGNNMEACIEGLKKAVSLTKNNKPVVILMKTEMGAGVDFMMGTHKWHGTSPNEEQYHCALNQLPETLKDF